MPTSKTRRKKSPNRVLALPDLEHAKTAVLNSLTSANGQRTPIPCASSPMSGMSQRVNFSVFGSNLQK